MPRNLRIAAGVLAAGVLAAVALAAVALAASLAAPCLLMRINAIVGGPGQTFGGFSSGSRRVGAVADLDVASAVDSGVARANVNDGSAGDRTPLSDTLRTQNQVMAQRGSALDRVR